MSMLIWAIVAGAGLLLGSIPTGLWMGRAFHGVDVRKHGSGNLGATNVYRTLGPRWGVLVLLLDAAKGWGAVALAGTLISGNSFAPLVGMAAAVLGHMFSPFAGFRGGKGVAAAAGSWAGLAVWPFLLAFGSWVIVFAASRIVSAASIVAAVLLPVSIAWLGPKPVTGNPIFYAGAITALLILVRHRSNLQRLIRGREKQLDLSGPSRHPRSP